MWLLYNILFAIGFTLMLPRFLRRMYRRGGYRRDFRQRLARYSPELAAALAARRRIWIHAVSVGEVAVARQFMKAWRERHPEAAFVLSTTSSTGRVQADAAAGPDDVVVYYPADFPRVVARALAQVQPMALLLVEGEIWPTMLRACGARGIPVAVLNARMTGRSHGGYRRIRPFIRRAVTSVRAVLVQTAADRDRWIDLGLPAGRVAVVGSMKYDLSPVASEAAQGARDVLRRIGWPADAVVLLGGSTWPGEEAALLDAYAALRPRWPALRLALVPRHAERREAVLAEIRAHDLTVWAKSRMDAWPAAAAAPDVLLVDTTGELRGFYAAADVAFVGKSLTEHGGQNPIEPAVEGRAVIVGPHMENFPDVADDFDAAEAWRRVADVGTLQAAVEWLLCDTAARRAMGARAAALVAANRGALARTVDAVERALGGGTGP